MPLAVTPVASSSTWHLRDRHDLQATLVDAREPRCWRPRTPLRSTRGSIGEGRRRKRRAGNETWSSRKRRPPCDRVDLTEHEVERVPVYWPRSNPDRPTAETESRVLVQEAQSSKASSLVPRRCGRTASVRPPPHRHAWRGKRTGPDDEEKQTHGGGGLPPARAPAESSGSPATHGDCATKQERAATESSTARPLWLPRRAAGRGSDEMKARPPKPSAASRWEPDIGAFLHKECHGDHARQIAPASR